MARLTTSLSQVTSALTQAESQQSSPQSSFKERELTISFGLSAGSFAGGSGSLRYSGLRISAKVTRAGDASMSMLSCAVYGLPLQVMNQLSTLGMQIRAVTSNTVTLLAGDKGDGNPSTVFDGNIIAAWFDGQAQPDVCLRVEAAEAGADAAAPAPATSREGSFDVVELLRNIAAQAKPPLTFENHGVSGIKIANPYYGSTIRNQVYEIIRDAGIEGGIVENRILSIWPRDGNRTGYNVTTSPTTGMIAYPSYTEQGIIVRTLYNPGIVLGGTITVQNSQLDKANGTWTIGGVTHDLESQTPHGAWFTTVAAYPVGLGPFLPIEPQ